jgi:hypothetical protein
MNNRQATFVAGRSLDLISNRSVLKNDALFGYLNLSLPEKGIKKPVILNASGAD